MEDKNCNAHIAKVNQFKKQYFKLGNKVYIYVIWRQFQSFQNTKFSLLKPSPFLVLIHPQPLINLWSNQTQKTSYGTLFSVIICSLDIVFLEKLVIWFEIESDWSCDLSTSNLRWPSNDATFDSHFQTCPQFKYMKNRCVDPGRSLKNLFINLFFFRLDEEFGLILSKHQAGQIITTGLQLIWKGLLLFPFKLIVGRLFQVQHDPKSRLRTLFVLQFVR